MENIDLITNLSYNSYVMTITKKQVRIWTLRIVLTTLCLLMIGFIISNSLQTSVESTKQSTTVTDKVQDVAGVVAPDSFVATATGAAYDKLQSIIRSIAHFLQFGVLGALVVWCYFSWTMQKKFLFIPFIFMLVFPFFDEFLQNYSSGRAAEWKDIFLDLSGGASGAVFALVSVGFVLWLRFRKRQKRLAKTE